MNSKSIGMNHFAGCMVGVISLLMSGGVAAQTFNSEKPITGEPVFGELLVYLPMNGGLLNEGTAGGLAEIIRFGDETGMVLVEGKFGPGMQFESDRVLAVPVSYSNDVYENSTFTAWVKSDDAAQAWGTVVSTGSGVRLSLLKRTSVATPGGPLYYTKEPLQDGEWSFVYLIVNSDDLTITVGKDSESYTHKLRSRIDLGDSGLLTIRQDTDREKSRYILVGSDHLHSKWPATSVVIDDVRVYGSALTAAQIQLLANAGSTGGPDDTTPSSSSVCGASDAAGTYRTANNLMECTATTATQLICRYGADHANTLTLEIAGDGKSAAGTWKQPSGFGGTAVFDVDESCSLTNGRWGIQTALPERPWDVTGEIDRVSGLDNTEPDGAGGLSDLVPPDGSSRGELDIERTLPGGLPGQPASGETPPSPGEDGGLINTDGPVNPDDGVVGELNPDFTVPEDLPGDQVAEAGQPRETPPIRDAVDEIICDSSSGAQPGILRSGQFPEKFLAALGKARECGLRVTVATINREGQWIVSTTDQLAHSQDVPSGLTPKLREFESAYQSLDAADIAENGAWVIVSGRNFAHDGLTARTASRIESAALGPSQLVSIDFHPVDNARWAAASENGAVMHEGMNDDFVRALPNRAVTQRNVFQVRLIDDGWLMLGTDYWMSSRNISNTTLAVLRTHQRSARRMDQVVLGNNSNDFLTYSAGPEAFRSGDPIYEIEHGTGRGTIWNRMEQYNLAAVSIAMIRDNEIAWARAYGLRNADQPESYANIETTFDAASISKPIAAFGLLQLVQDRKVSLTDEGVLEDLEDLFDNDDDIATYRSALSPSTGNLNQLLQHCLAICYGSASATCPAGGAATYDLNRSIPTTSEMILGDGRARQSHRLTRNLNTSGDISRYTSANFMLVQALIDVHGGGFLNHMSALLDTLGMNKATYMSPYPQRNAGNFARGWDGSAVMPMVGYGEMAAASLVARPIDIARFVIAVNELAQDSAATEPLSNANVQRFLGRDTSIYNSTDYSVCDATTAGSENWALGIRRGMGWRGNTYYTHGGIHNGYRTRMVGIDSEDSGVVVFMTGASSGADSFFVELRSAILNNYRF